MVEGVARRALAQHHALAPASALHFQRAMMAIGVVAGLAEQAVRHPGAAAHALGGVVAVAAVTPQVVQRTVARVAYRRCALPQVAQRMLAYAAARPLRRGQGGAALYRAVGLEPQHRFAGSARAAVLLRHIAAQQRFVRTEVTDVVAGEDPHALRLGARMQASDQRQYLEQLI